jgi:hypothetical protein
MYTYDDLHIINRAQNGLRWFDVYKCKGVSDV